MPAARATLSSNNVAYVYDDTLFPCAPTSGTGCGMNDTTYAGASIFTNAVSGSQPGSGDTGTYTPSGGSAVTLTNIPLSTLDANPTALAGYDTAILYMTCDIGAPANAAALAEINAYLNIGGKVMIFDADGCAPSSDGTPDWSGFVYPFATNNPGPQGASGSYTAIEASPLTAGFTVGESDTDAQGDANIFTTYDSHWFRAIAATNANNVTGTVEAYAKVPSGGLALYSGEDFWATDSPTAHLQQVFDQMLEKQWSPDNLPGTTPVCTSNCTGPPPPSPTATTDNGLGAPVPTCPNHSITLPGGITVEASCFTVTPGGELTTTGHIRVNGLDIVISGSGGFTLDPKKLELSAAGEVDAYAGSLHIYHGSLSWSFTQALSLGLPSNLTVKGLPISGDATLTLASGGLDAIVNASIGYGGFVVSGAIDLKLTLDAGLELDSLKLALASDVPIKSLLVKKATLTYTHHSSGDVWAGDVAVQLPANGPVVEGSLAITNGALSEIYLSVSGINKPLGEVVFLQSLGLKVDFAPHLAATGAIGLSAGPAIDGRTAASLDGSLEADIGSPFVLTAAGTLSIIDQKLASASVKATIPGGVSFKGDLSASFLVIRLDGEVSGNITSGSFDAEGGVTVHAPLVSATGDALVDNVGIAGCASAQIGATVFGHFIGKTVTVGGSHRWSGENSIFGDSCGFDKLHSALNGHAAAAGGARATIRVPSHTRQLNIVVRGAGGPPVVEIAHGRTTAVVVPNSTGAFGHTVYLAIADPANAETDIAIADPPKGTLAVDPVPGGQPTITGVSFSRPLPRPAVRLRLRRIGPRRYLLRFAARRMPGQRLVLEYRDSSGVRRLRATARARGVLRFTAIDDGSTGVHRVRVVVTQDGLVRAVVPGPKFTPARVRLRAPRVRVRLRRHKAVVSWSAIANAARYDVSIATSDGRHLFFETRPSHRIVRLRSARVVFARVWGVGAGMELGRPGRASAHVKARAKHHRRKHHR